VAVRNSQAGPAPLLDYESAAPFLGCTPRMVRKLVEDRRLESVKVGRLVRIEPAAITRYIEEHRRVAVRR
jgi:excisionase family DNA binding protein